MAGNRSEEERRLELRQEGFILRRAPCLPPGHQGWEGEDQQTTAVEIEGERRLFHSRVGAHARHLSYQPEACGLSVERKARVFPQEARAVPCEAAGGAFPACSLSQARTQRNKRGEEPRHVLGVGTEAEFRVVGQERRALGDLGQASHQHPIHLGCQEALKEQALHKAIRRLQLGHEGFILRRASLLSPRHQCGERKDQHPAAVEVERECRLFHSRVGAYARQRRREMEACGLGVERKGGLFYQEARAVLGEEAGGA